MFICNKGQFYPLFVIQRNINISKACEYGIRALTIIAKESEKGKRIGILEISRIAKTPESFTAKILQTLVRKDILHSQKGPLGGFYLARDINSLTLYEIVEALDGTEIFNECGLGLDKCDARNPCPLHKELEKVRKNLKMMCKNNTLESITSDIAIDVYQR